MLTTFFVVATMVVSSTATHADVTVKVETDAAWQAFMGVSEADRTGALPAQGAFVFDGAWGVADTTAVFDGPGNTLTLGPNTIGDPDPFWYIGGGAPGALGNKWMDANTFVQVDDTFAGMNVTFEGEVLSNSLTANHTATVFIRDFAPDFSSFTESTAALTPGAFSISLMTDAGAGRHVQYGFNMQGENVWITDVGGFGNVVLVSIPEPGSIAFIGLGAMGLLLRRRR